MLEMGIIVGLGLLVMLVKLPWVWKIRVLSYPLTIDIAVFIVLCILHWGTFSGVMVATIGAFFCSVVLALGKAAVGYSKHGKYIRGWVDVSSKLKEPT